MGRLGYQSDAQSSLAVSYNSLDSYGASLQEALTQPYPAYESDRHPRRRRLQPARHEPAADRERVLRHDPAQARDPPRRAAAACAARARRRVRRSAPDGPRPVRAGRHQRGDHALPRRLPAALPADRQPARHARRRSRDPAQQAARRLARPRARPDAACATAARFALVEWGGERARANARRSPRRSIAARETAIAHAQAVAQARASLADPQTRRPRRACSPRCTRAAIRTCASCWSQSIAHKRRAAGAAPGRPRPRTASPREAEASSRSSAASRQRTSSRSRRTARTTWRRSACASSRLPFARQCLTRRRGPSNT